ncbi:MAG: undecaprenyldiphospho-muramoylpentapeptide beta-N-acetylglucosaminyltransferase [Actinomycetota bacterium]
MSAAVFAIIAGGGTAGHVTPGVAVARELAGRGHEPSSLHFVGAQRGVEADVVPAAGFPLTLLPGRGIKRSLSLSNIGAVAGLLAAIVRAILLVRRLRPRVVLATGGFASVPCVLGALVWRVPIVVAEQNAVPGAANRLASRWARACAVSFPGTDLPNAVVTGNPVRSEILGAAALRGRPAPEAATRQVLVFGGSLGALHINRTVLDLVGSEPPPARVRHLIGRRDWPELVETAEALARTADYEPVEYEHDMASALVATDLAVCRAGASTVAELAVTGTPSILIPLPGAPGDHQTANARGLQEAGAAVVLPDAELEPSTLSEAITGILADDDRLDRMAEAARGFARPDAAARVADLVEEHAT